MRVTPIRALENTATRRARTVAAAARPSAWIGPTASTRRARPWRQVGDRTTQRAAVDSGREEGLSWEAFASAILVGTRPGNDGNMMLPYFVPETTPRLLHPEPRWFGSRDFTEGRDAVRAARAIVEAQALGMRMFSSFIGEKPETVLVTGGASKNRGVLRVLADVLGAEIRPLTVANSSALGGALRAAQATERMPWADLFARFAATDPALRVSPDPSTFATYQELGAQFERRVEQFVAAQ
jgi:xylulokinase